MSTPPPEERPARRFSVDDLARRLEAACPEIVLAFLHGSAKDGFVGAKSDIDLALLIDGRPTAGLYHRASDAVFALGVDAEPDIGILNRAEPIYRFEALKGRLLVCRDRERYLEFFSRTCREYEYQIADYDRQRKYRLGIA